MSDKCLDYPIGKNLKLLKDDKVMPPFNINTTIPYECNIGYILSNSSISAQNRAPLFTCKLSNNNIAVWQIESECKPVSCGDPGYVENANKTGLDYTFAKSVKYECHEGYKMTGIGTLYCGVNGLWSPSSKQIKCVSTADCSYLDAPLNGFITYTNNQSIGSEAHYSCKKGYELYGDSIRQCSENATWTGSVPECRIINCPPPDPFPNGIIYPKQQIYEFQNIIFYNCPLTNQTSKAICKENGKWSNPPPLCEIKTTLQQDRPATTKRQISLKQSEKAKRINFQNFIVYFIYSILIILIMISIIIYKLS